MYKRQARNRGYEFTIPPEDVFGQNDPLVKQDNLNIYNVFENVSNNKIEITKKYVVYIGDPQEEIIEQYNTMFGKISTPTKKLIV